MVYFSLRDIFGEYTPTKEFRIKQLVEWSEGVEVSKQFHVEILHVKKFAHIIISRHWFRTGKVFYTIEEARKYITDRTSSKIWNGTETTIVE